MCKVPASGNGYFYELSNSSGPSNCAYTLGTYTWIDLSGYYGGGQETPMVYPDQPDQITQTLPLTLMDVAAACQGAQDTLANPVRADCIYTYMVERARPFSEANQECYEAYPPSYQMYYTSGASQLSNPISALLTGARNLLGLGH